MNLDFGREVCGNLAVAERREWLVTNGIGGFACGSIAGVLTRRYHGLLLAALQPPLGRTLLVAKIDETAEYDGENENSGRYFPLYLNRWASGPVEPDDRYLDRFRLEGSIPIWTFGLADALLEKRIWMEPGANTTYIQYHLARAAGPLVLDGRIFVNYRDYHSTTIMNDWRPEILQVENGLQLSLFDGANPFYLFSSAAKLTPQFEWYEDFFLSEEEYRGQNDVEEDHIYGANLRVTIQPGGSVTLVASTEPGPELDGAAAYAVRRAADCRLLEKTRKWQGCDLPPAVAQLVLAADQFVVQRETAGDGDGRSIIAGYPWFSDWGRDTMIALPGLTLTTGRPLAAAKILRTYAHFVDRGMLPNRFPDAGERPEYNTVDATLWFFEAVRAYFAATKDKTLIADLFPVLADIVNWHRQGTRYQIKMDESDGLIFAGEEGVQLTWMDAKVDGWVVTPRIGKPVEINALWYNGLSIMADFARLLGQDAARFERLAAKVRAGFQRFWREELGYCFDVLDGPEGNDGRLRPNQLLAVSLPHSPLLPEQQRSLLNACGRRLLTPHGLRSLSPDDEDYIGHYGGDQMKRDAAYHQGTVWSWLIGPFVSAHLRVYQDPCLARSFLSPLLHHLADHGVGSISECFDGDPPFMPRACFAQAWGVAELLRTWFETEPVE